MENQKFIIHNSSDTNFRVEEYDGDFQIQRKTVKIVITGILWWKKETEVTEWSYVNRFGEPIFTIYHPIYYRCSKISPFKDLQSAFNKIDTMTVGAIYHYYNGKLKP